MLRLRPKILNAARIIPGLFACGLLSACLDIPGAGQDVQIPERASVFDGSVTIVAPEGYCFDSRGSKLSDEVSVLLFASCASLGQSGARMPQTRAILTATLRTEPLPAAARAPDQLAAFFNSNRGRALLSRTGSADGIISLEHGVWSGDVFWLRATEANSPEQPLSPVLWHAMLEVAGYGMNISVYPAATDTAPRPAETRELLRRFIDRTRMANGES